MCYDISPGAKTYKYINSDTTGFPSATNNPLHKQRCTHLPPLQQPCCSNAYNTSEIMDISPPPKTMHQISNLLLWLMTGHSLMQRIHDEVHK